jgi:hypothetical protein
LGLADAYHTLHQILKPFNTKNPPLLGLQALHAKKFSDKKNFEPEKFQA